ncbi:MAG: DUF6565 domain-containing protein [Chitinophagales bacterium]
MKIFNWTLILFILLGALNSCKSSEEKLIDEINAFVSNVEQNKKEFSENDWENSDQTIESLQQKYEQLKDNMSPQQRLAVNEQVGKYQALRLRSGLNGLIDLKDKIVDFGNQVEGALQELSDTSSK